MADESGNRASSTSLFSGEDTPPPPQQDPPPPKSKAVPAPKEKGRAKKAEGGGKEAGAAKKEEGGGGALSSCGRPAHVPNGGGVEMGTVTGVHTCKSGVVWVRYPNDPKLCEVERHLIFGMPEAAEAYLQKVCKGKTPTTNPPPQRNGQAHEL